MIIIISEDILSIKKLVNIHLSVSRDLIKFIEFNQNYLFDMSS